MSCAKFCVAYVAAIILAVPSYAQTQSVANVEDFLRVVEERAPELQLQRSEVSVNERLVDKAGQFLNPDLTLGSWKGNARSLDWQQTDVSLLQPIELGGKRSGRIEYARAQTELARSNLSRGRNEIRASALLTLHRLRQLIYEKTLIEEAQVAFDKLIRTFKKRPQLSPEQSTSLFLFQMAKRDYDLQNTSALNEYRVLAQEVKRISGLDVSSVVTVLPKKVSNWPRVSPNLDLNSPELHIAKAQVDVSKSELNLAKSESWPTPSVGPSYTDQNQFGEQAKVLGFVVSTKLPILSLNQGGRAAARENVSLNEKSYQFVENRLKLQKENLISSYNANVETLKVTNVDDTIHKKHEQIENYFLRGLVNSALVIEAHRQILDSQRNYHSSEIDTLDKYYRIRITEGNFLEGGIL